MADRRPRLQVMGAPAPRAQQGTPMEIGEFAPHGHEGHDDRPPLLNGVDRGHKGKGNGKDRDSRPVAPGKSKGKGKSKDSKGMGRERRDLVCDQCGGRGHPARFCPTPPDMNELEQEDQGEEYLAEKSEDE